MSKYFKSLMAVTIISISAGAVAQQAPKPEALIKWRQSVFQVVAWNSSRIKANVEGTYNKEDVLRAANTIAAISNSGLSILFVPGTEQGKGWHDTAVKPELFKDEKKVTDLFGSFSREANELVKVASNSDAAAVKEQLGKLSKSCKACHDDYKAKE